MKTFFPRMEQAGDAGAGGGNSASGAQSGQGAGQGSTLLGSGSGTQGTAQGHGTVQTAAAGATGSAVVEPYFKDWLKADGTLNHAAYERLPEHLKPYADSFKKYGKLDDLLGGFVHSMHLNGKKGLMPLPANADDKAKAEFSSRLRELLNVPEKPEGYGVKKPDDLPDELWNGDYVNSAIAIMHKYNVPPEAVRALVENDAKFAGTMRANSEAAKAQALEAAAQDLRQTFGADFDKKMGLAQRAAKTFGLDVDDPEIGNNPKIIKFLANVAGKISEDQLVNGGSDPVGGLGDKGKAEDIVNNSSNPLHKAYHDASDPRHEAAVAQVQALMTSYISRQKKAG